MQIVEHLRLPSDEGVQHIAGKLQSEPHGVAIVVVRHVVSPINEVGPLLAGVGEVPAVDVDHAVAAVHLHHRGNQRDDVIADGLDVGAVVHRQPVGQFHERRGRAGFGGVDGAGDVVDGRGSGHQAIGLGIVEMDGAGVAKLRQAGAILVELRHQALRRYGDGDRLAALFGLADAEDFDPRRGGFQHAHIAIDLGGIRQDAGRAGDVAEHGFGSGHGLRGGQVIGKRRVEKGLGGVFADLPGVLLVDGLAGIAAGLEGYGEAGLGEQRKREERDKKRAKQAHRGNITNSAEPPRGAR